MKPKALWPLVLFGTLAISPIAEGRRESQTVPVNLEGGDCSAVAEASTRMPRTARLISVNAPGVGDTFSGEKAGGFPKADLGVITGIEIEGRRIVVSAQADPALCRTASVPGEPLDAEWSAAIDLSVSYTSVSLAWARRTTRDSIRQNLGDGFVTPRMTRVTCRRRSTSTYFCRFVTVAGDTSASGSGTVALAVDAVAPRVRFRVRIVNEYCLLVQRKPATRCIGRRSWSF
jgi:hypothetical protein